MTVSPDGPRCRSSPYPVLPHSWGSDSFPLQVTAVFKCWAPMPKSLSAHELLPPSSLLTLTDRRANRRGLDGDGSGA